MDGTEEPDFQKTPDCHGDLRTLCGRPRQRSDLNDKCFCGIAILISLVSTVASLSFFLFPLRAGALVDTVVLRVGFFGAFL
jgi:hypothetical protein